MSNLLAPLNVRWTNSAAGVVLSWQSNPANPAGTLVAIGRTDRIGYIATALAGTSWTDPNPPANVRYGYWLYPQSAAGVVTTASAAGIWGTFLAPVALSTPTPPQVAPGLPSMAASAPYSSDAWLATFARDADGFVCPPIPANAVVVGGSGAFAAHDFKSAQKLAQSNGSFCVLFQRGKTYGPDQLNDNIQLCGPSTSKPFIVSATTDVANPRPVLAKGFGIGGTEYSSGPFRNLIVASLDFNDPAGQTAAGSVQGAALRFASLGASAPAGSGWILVEDCRIQGFGGAFDFEAPVPASFLQTVIFRRCAAFNCWAARGNSEALYVEHVQDLLVDQCLFDQCGWNPQFLPKSLLDHDAYDQVYQSPEDPKTRFIENVFARASSHGLQQRSGGLQEGNLYLGCPIAGFAGPTGQAWLISNGVIDAGGGEFDLNIGPANLRGWGLSLNCVPSGAMTNLLAINRPAKGVDPGGAAFEIQCAASSSAPNVPTVATLTALIASGWNGPAFAVSGTPGALSFVGCDLPGYGVPGSSATPSYADPSRSTARYAQTLGLSNASALLAAMLNNRRGNWSNALTAPAVNAYIRAGFQNQ